MKTIIGLGNKGKEYKKTRHNIGEHIVQLLAESLGGEFKDDKYILSNTTKIDDGTLFIVPELYMNESGKAIDGLYKMKNEDAEYRDLLVVRDDIEDTTNVCRND